MPPEVLVHAGPRARGDRWAALLPGIVPGLVVRQWGDDPGPAERVRYAAAWTLPDGLFAACPSLTALFSVGAGVDQLDPAAIPARVALIRTVEPGLVEEMVDYATLAVLALHRDLPHYRTAQREGRWAPRPVRARHDTPVGILGLGAMGGAIATRIAALGFGVRGWSRSGRSLPGVESFAGAEALPAFLGGCAILICALPLTAQTRHILNAATLAMLPGGAAVVNIGRGGHVDTAALLAALDAGRLSAAMLDVTDPEPLPPGHPLWSHPRVWLTPHIAGETDIDGGARAIGAAILRLRAGQPVPGLVDRRSGY